MGLIPLVSAGCIPQPDAKEGEQDPSSKMNVILIAIDDLRTELGYYENNQAITPNFDRLADNGVAFLNAYCQVSLSAPSRASLMTGLRPDALRVWDLRDSFRKINPDIITMPQYFKKFGYHTVSIGKIFHNHMPDSISFDEPDLRPEAYKTPELINRDAESFYVDHKLMLDLDSVRSERISKRKYGVGGGWNYGVAVENTDAEDSLFYDGAQTELAIRKLKELKKNNKPFFLALGFYKPHLPFSAPKKYWDLYDRNNIRQPDNKYLPIGSPVMAADNNYELNACYDLRVNHPALYSMSDDTALLLKHGYLACVSFIDACLGKILDELERLELSDNTMIVLYGDNGYKLGEHNGWCKQTNYKTDINVPLIVSTPKMKTKGLKSNTVTELLDVFPTICDEVGIPIPEYLDGASLKPLFSNPDKPVKKAAYSQIHRFPHISLDGKRYMGLSMMTDRWHYIKWYHWNDITKQLLEPVECELYDLRNDKNENRNLSRLAKYARIIEKLDNGLQAIRNEETTEN